MAASPALRVLFVGPRASARGGIAQFSSHLVGAVSAECRTSVIGFTRLYPRWTRAGRQGDDPSKRRLHVPESANVVPWFPWTWPSAARELAAFRPHVVVIQWWHPLFAPVLRFLAWRARSSGARVAVVCHNAVPHEPFPLSAWLSRSALSRADVLFALSRAVADRLTELLPEAAVEVLRHPPYQIFEAGGAEEAGDREWRRRLGDVDRPIVLFFGNVRSYKGLHDLIAAIPLVRRRVSANFVVAGTFFQPLEGFERQAQDLGVREYVHFLPGYVANEDVRALFRFADVLALPYRSASQSGILPQAAAFEKPVVATDVGGIADELAGRGIVVSPENPASLADGLVRALLDPPPPPRKREDGWALWRDRIVAVAADARGERANVGSLSPRNHRRQRVQGSSIPAREASK